MLGAEDEAMRRAKFIRKTDSWLMRTIGWLLRVSGINDRFMDHYWTTIGDRIYYPARIKQPHDLQHFGIREHEQMHVEQFYRAGLGLWPLGVVVLAVVYLFLPLPLWFSGRWFIERGPHLLDIKTGRRGLTQAIEGLHKGYWRPWPKSWMREWFSDRLSCHEYTVAIQLDAERGFMYEP